MQRPTRLPVLLLQARNAVVRAYKVAMAGHDLTEPQFRIMLSLRHNDRLDVSSLQDLTDLHQASVSRILRNLETRGLLLRANDHEDARRSLAILTREGRELIDATMIDVDAANAELEERLGAEFVTLLRSVLDRTIAICGEDAQAPSA